MLLLDIFFEKPPNNIDFKKPHCLENIEADV
jgi:hypothetical protein